MAVGGRLRGWLGQKSLIAASPAWPGMLARFQPADGWARVPGRHGSGLWVPRDAVLWSGFHKGGTPLCPGSGGGQPLGRTTSGGESRDSKGRLWSPFSAEHRLRCITALFVSFSLRPVLWPSRSQTDFGRLAFARGLKQTAMDADALPKTPPDESLETGCQSQSPRDSSRKF